MLAGAEQGDRPVLERMFRRGSKKDDAQGADHKLAQLNFCFSQVASRNRHNFFEQANIYRTTGSAALVERAFNELMEKDPTVDAMKIDAYLQAFLEQNGARNASGLHRKVLSEMEVLSSSIRKKLLQAYKRDGSKPSKCAWEFNRILRQGLLTSAEASRARAAFKFFNEVVQYADRNQMPAEALATAMGPVIFLYDAKQPMLLPFWGAEKRQRVQLESNRAAGKMQEEHNRVFQLMVEEFDIVFHGLH